MRFKILILAAIFHLSTNFAATGVKISAYPRATTLGANDLFIVSYYSGSAYTTNKAISYSDFSLQLLNSPLLVTPNIGAATGASLDTSGDIRGNTIHGTNGFYVKDLSASVLLRLDASKKIAPVTVGANLTFDGLTLSATGGGGGTSVYLNGASISNPNFLDSSTAIWGVSAVTNITVNPTNISNAQISASAAIPVSKLDLSGRILTAGTGLSGGGNLSADRTFSVTTNTVQQPIWVRTGVTNNGVFGNITFWPGNNIVIGVTNGTGNTNIDLTITASFTITNKLTRALSDMTSALTTGTNKNFWIPKDACTVKYVRANVSTVSGSGLPTFDILKNGTSILSTAITIDANERSSDTAATPPVISVSAIAADDYVNFSITGAGTGTTGAQIEIGYTIP